VVLAARERGGVNGALQRGTPHATFFQLLMAEDNRYNDDDKNSKRGGDFRVPPRTWIVWIAIFGGIILLMLFRERMDSQGEFISQYRFQQLVESNLVAQATVNYNPQSPALTEIIGNYKTEGEAPITSRKTVRTNCFRFGPKRA
jgi:hypothetical protein